MPTAAPTPRDEPREFSTTSLALAALLIHKLNLEPLRFDPPLHGSNRWIVVFPSSVQTEALVAEWEGGIFRDFEAYSGVLDRLHWRIKQERKGVSK